MMSLVIGLFIGGSFGLVIAVLLISSGRASEDERVQKAYKAGLDEGSLSKIGQVVHPSYEVCFPNEAEMIRAWLVDWNVKLSPWQRQRLDEIARQIDERDGPQQN